MKARLTKKTVLDEVNALRDRIRQLSEMTDNDLLDEYNKCYPKASIPEIEKEGMRVAIMKSLLLSATYYLTNVLNLE